MLKSLSLHHLSKIVYFRYKYLILRKPLFININLINIKIK